MHIFSKANMVDEEEFSAYLLGDCPDSGTLHCLYLAL